MGWGEPPYEWELVLEQDQIFEAIHTFSSYAGKAHIVAGVRTGKNNKFVTSAWGRAIALILSFGLVSAIAMAVELSGKVIGVSDGDTIKVLDDSHHAHTIRLMGIDAPEKAQAWGHRSKQSLYDLVFEKQVSVLWSKRDKYGRIVGKVLTTDGVDICLEQITQGMAWHYKKYAGEQSADDHARYSAAENAAQASQLGVWTTVSPVPPWEWRYNRH